MKNKTFTAQQVIDMLTGLKQFDLYADSPGCTCCSPTVVFDENNYNTGEVVKVEDINQLIKSLK